MPELFWQAIEAAPVSDISRASAAHNDAIIALALQYHTGLAELSVDLASRSRCGSPGADMFQDFHHPNGNGARLMAAGYARELGRLFGQKPNFSPGWELRVKTGQNPRDRAESTWHWNSFRHILLYTYPEGDWYPDRLTLLRRNLDDLKTTPYDEEEAVLAELLLEAVSCLPKAQVQAFVVMIPATPCAVVSALVRQALARVRQKQALRAGDK